MWSTGTLKEVGPLKTLCKEAGIYGPVFVQGYPFDVDTCCTVCREGTVQPYPEIPVEVIPAMC